MIFRKMAAIATVTLSIISGAFGQSGQMPSGTLWGNPGASLGLGTASLPLPVLDRGGATGISGHKLPYLDTFNTWGANQTVPFPVAISQSPGQVHQNYGFPCRGRFLCQGNQNYDLQADHLSLETADASELNLLNLGGSVQAGDVGKQVGINFVVAGVSFPIRYTIQAGDIGSLFSVAVGIAAASTSAIIQTSGTNPMILISGAASSGVTSHGTNLVRLTVGSTATIPQLNGNPFSQGSTVSGVRGTTEANGSWDIFVVDGTHIDLLGTTFTNVFVPSTAANALGAAMLAFTDAIGFGYALRIGADTTPRVVFDFPWGASNSMTPFVEAGSNVTITATGGGLDNGPFYSGIRSVPGRAAKVGDEGWAFQNGGSAGATVINQVVIDITNPSSPGAALRFGTSSAATGGLANYKLFIGEGMNGSLGGNPCGGADAGLGWWLTCTGLYLGDTNHKIYNFGTGLGIVANDLVALSANGGTTSLRLTATALDINLDNTVALGTSSTRWAGISTVNADIWGAIVLHGASAGTLALFPPATASGSITFPAGTVDFSATGCAGCFVRQEAGATFTVTTVPASAISSGAALTKTDDTNITVSLTGSPTTSLLAATNMAFLWAGQLALSRGGTAANLTASNGGLVYSTGSALAILSGTATAGQIPRSGSNAAPSWSTATYPATAGTLANVLRSDGTNFLSAALACADLSDDGAFCSSTDAANLSGTVASARIAGAYTGFTSITSSGLITGSAFTPTGSSAPTNGMYLPAANTVSIAVNSTAKLQVASNSVTVNSTISSSSFPFIVHAATNENFGVTGHSSASSGVAFSAFNDAVNANVPIEIRASETYLGLIGNVSIGLTTAPAVLLHVHGAVRFDSFGAGIATFNASGDFSSTAGITGTRAVTTATGTCTFTYANGVVTGTTGSCP